MIKPAKRKIKDELTIKSPTDIDQKFVTLERSHYGLAPARNRDTHSQDKTLGLYIHSIIRLERDR